MSAQVIVVGGGIAGLVFARDVARAGRRVVLLEALDRLGGQVCRHTVGGISLDAGAESFATRGGIVAALAVELGLSDHIVAPAAEGAWLQPVTGSAVPLPSTSLLGIPGVPAASDVVAVLGAGAAFRAFLTDALLPGTVGSKSTTLGELVRRRMGDAVVDKLVAPVAQGVHSGHPDDLDLDRVAPGIRNAMLREGSLARGVRHLRANAPAGSQVRGLRGGVSTLVDALLADLKNLGAEVRTSTPARELGTDQVVTDADLLQGDVVIAAPALGRADQHQAGAKQAADVTLVTLIVEDRRLDAAPRGTGLLVAPGTSGVRAKALTHVTAKWRWVAEAAGGRHVLRLSYADPREQAPDAETVRRDASTLLGIELDATSVAAIAAVSWRRAAPESAENRGPLRVGEAVAGPGLAAVIGHARKVAGSYLEGHGR
jgi:oxygen-dependent protoporphyrinogen oxidase